MPYPVILYIRWYAFQSLRPLVIMHYLLIRPNRRYPYLLISADISLELKKVTVDPPSFNWFPPILLYLFLHLLCCFPPRLRFSSSFETKCFPIIFFSFSGRNRTLNSRTLSRTLNSLKCLQELFVHFHPATLCSVEWRVKTPRICTYGLVYLFIT